MTGRIEPTTAAAANRRFRTLVPDIDPDAVYRDIREAGGFRSWEDPSRTLYYLAQTAVEVYQVGGGWVLTVNGPSVDTVREGLRMLGCGADRDVHELQGAA
ncbi:hypothetical protein AB0L13_11500 [Saccharopolyspora shandongensis]|uniref:hypothetical protein n=1 Tax=Saccharopolyspora shandongensis TaxID=418495 RepID=UPI0034455292